MTALSQSPSRLPLPLNEIIPLAHSLASREAHRPDDVEDLVQEALFAYHRAEQRYAHERITVLKPWAFVRTTLQRAMRKYYWQQGEWQGRGEVSTAVSLDQFGSEIPSFDDLFECLELADYFSTLEATLGTTARTIAENLVMPYGDCAVRLLCEINDKQRRQDYFQSKSRKVRGHQPRGVKHQVRITPRQIRDALQISPQEWTRTMECIRDFTRVWIQD